MIKSVTVTNYLGERKKIELAAPIQSGFAISKIEGLGPSKANINVTERATGDGSSYNSGRVTARNIVMHLIFDPRYDPEYLRYESYKVFPIKKQVRLLIETDRRKCETIGYIESNEPEIFSKRESAEISIICPDPYFYSAGDEGDNVTSFYSIIPLFEFPFSNESLDESLIEFGSIELFPEKAIPYDGDAEVGITIRIHALGDASNISIFNVGTREQMTIDTEKLKIMTGYGIKSADEIIISTTTGNHSVKLLRDGIYTNIINCLGRNADWFELSKGDNIFAYTADSGISNLQFTIENKKVYEGV